MRHWVVVGNLLEQAIKRIGEPGPVLAAEIGVYRGRTSEYLLNRFPNLHLLMIDPWSAREAYRKSGSKIARRSPARFDEYMAEALERTAFAARRRSILAVESMVALNWIADQSLWMAFIDGDHSQEAVTHDMGWFAKVRAGGAFCGDDYTGRFGGAVKQAVDGWAEQAGVTVCQQGKVWFVVWFVQPASGESTAFRQPI